MVIRTTARAQDPVNKRWYHSLHADDQGYAYVITNLVQEAATYFFASDEAYIPIEGVDGIIISDEEVVERIHRLTYGENEREARRTARANQRDREFFLFDTLPFDQQRALIERIEAKKLESGFSIIGEMSEEQYAQFNTVPSIIPDINDLSMVGNEEQG